MNKFESGAKKGAPTLEEQKKTHIAIRPAVNEVMKRLYPEKTPSPFANTERDSNLDLAKQHRKTEITDVEIENAIAKNKEKGDTRKILEDLATDFLVAHKRPPDGMELMEFWDLYKNSNIKREEAA